MPTLHKVNLTSNLITTAIQVQVLDPPLAAISNFLEYVYSNCKIYFQNFNTNLDKKELHF